MEDGQRGRNGQIAVPIVVKVSKEEIENVTIPFQDGEVQFAKAPMWTEPNVPRLVQVWRSYDYCCGALDLVLILTETSICTSTTNSILEW